MGTRTQQPAKPARKVGVDMNLAGSWKSLGTFNLDDCDIDAVLDAAEVIVTNQASGGTTGKLRITDAMQTPPLVLQYWSHDKGWEDSRHVAR